ncbi:MAG: hemin receptor [Prevotellaceae bacterium]|nr:hemin receptor [Prevotellaceae bacterium]
MKRLIFIFAASSLFLSTYAQETYENANIATEDLNGTARYVGMGGALDALGADISTIGTNPAGIGMFRHSTANVSIGMVSQQDAQSFANGNKTNMSFDQAGFVYSRRTGRNSFLNVAFNYHKSRNFDYILSASNSLNGASQNKLSYIKGAAGVFDVSTNNNGTVSSNSNAFSQVDYLYYNVLLQNAGSEGSFYYNNASGYAFDRSNTGYIGEYDYNISGNINDRVYLGLTFGISDVHYKGYSEYTEALVDANNGSVGSVTLADERRITGTGFNIKAGVIIRPVETSPFRIGLSIATPTWYDLTTTNYTTLVNNSTVGAYDSGSIGETYDFKLYTPWKFGFSLGTTVANCLAIGAGYEYSDYSSLDSRINTGGGYDWYYDSYYENSSSDDNMNRHTEYTLKGVNTVKVGLEYKPESNFAIRLGYNYVSPMYQSDGYKDGTLNSPGSYYASATDYTNWKSTNRITCGFGYNVGKLSLDLAYQYSVQSGDFSPFVNYYSSDSAEDNNICDAVKVDNKRHQLLFTLGYHF